MMLFSWLPAQPTANARIFLSLLLRRFSPTSHVTICFGKFVFVFDKYLTAVMQLHYNFIAFTPDAALGTSLPHPALLPVLLMVKQGVASHLF